ncbi:hypothetical protein FHG87_010117 [Trinorchestia longiramus]|nr:hypothetical protein FHG87_010117 [Trinorchestia longiramus]
MTAADIVVGIHLQLVALAGGGVVLPAGVVQHIAAGAGGDIRAAVTALHYHLMHRNLTCDERSPVLPLPSSTTYIPDDSLYEELSVLFPGVAVRAIDSISPFSSFLYSNQTDFLSDSPHVHFYLNRRGGVQSIPECAQNCESCKSKNNESSTSDRCSESCSEKDRVNIVLGSNMTIFPCRMLPFSTLHVLMPMLLPFPKKDMEAKKPKYPLRLDDPGLKKTPLYQKYSWLGIDSDSDCDLIRSPTRKKRTVSESDTSDSNGENAVEEPGKNEGSSTAELVDGFVTGRIAACVKEKHRAETPTSENQTEKVTEDQELGINADNLAVEKDIDKSDGGGIEAPSSKSIVSELRKYRKGSSGGPSCMSEGRSRNQDDFTVRLEGLKVQPNFTASTKPQKNTSKLSRKTSSLKVSRGTELASKSAAVLALASLSSMADSFADMDVLSTPCYVKDNSCFLDTGSPHSSYHSMPSNSMLRNCSYFSNTITNSSSTAHIDNDATKCPDAKFPTRTSSLNVDGDDFHNEYHYRSINFQKCLDFYSELSASQGQKIKCSALTASLSDDHSVEFFNSYSLVHTEIVSELAEKSVIFHQRQIEYIVARTPEFTCSENKSFLQKMSVPNLFSSLSKNSCHDLKSSEKLFVLDKEYFTGHVQNLPLYSKLLSSQPFTHWLTSSSYEIISCLRQLARQDAVNKAVNLLKRSRRRSVVRGGGCSLLSLVGVGRLGEDTLNAMANALTDDFS